MNSRKSIGRSGGRAAAVVVSAVLALLAGTGTGAAEAASPHIDGYTPAAGPTTGGATLTITGSNFSAAGNAVTIGSGACPPTSESASMILCTIPEGTGKDLAISVVDALGTPSDNTVQYSYDAPLISGITPVQASTAGGAILTIFGSNFGPASADAKRSVSFGSAGGSCAIVPGQGSHGSVECTLPEGQGGPHDVAVTVDGQTSNARQFTYSPPAISSISPAEGREAGGVRLTISGSNFGTLATALVNGHDCPVDVQTHTSLQCTVPSGTGTGVDVLVLVSGQVSNAKPFDYLPAPVVGSISPAHASTSGGIPLTINGNWFSATSNTVHVGINECVPDTQLRTQIVCTLPEGTGAGQTVSVTSDGVDANSSLFDYDAPVIDSITPAARPTAGGTHLTIHGDNFGPAAADSLRSVAIGMADCPVVAGAGGHTSFECVLPAGQGTGFSTVVTVDHQSSLPAILDYDPPSIDTITPAHLSVAGGFPIMISGANFGVDASATVGGAACPRVSQTDDSFVCTLPPGAAGPAGVSVVVSGQSATSSLDYSPIVCGDTFVDQGEVCDDGNNNDGDGCSSDCKPEHSETKDQQACIVALNKAGAGVAKAQGKAVLDCAKSASAGVACVDSSVPSSLAKATQKTSDAVTKKCPTAPDFGPTGATTTNDAATGSMLDLAHDLFGADADGALLPDAMNPGRASCQQDVIAASNKLVASALKVFGKCKKAGLKDGTIASAAGLREYCIKVMADDGSLDKATAALTSVFSAGCSGVALSSAFPGTCASEPSIPACIERRTRCRACVMIEMTDGMSNSCDTFDDGTGNGSCP